MKSRKLIIWALIALVTMAIGMDELSGKHDITLNVYDSPTGGELLWTRSFSQIQFTAGSPDIDIHGIIASRGFAKDLVYVQLSIDGESLESSRIEIPTATSLRRDREPEEPGEAEEELEGELQIGFPGEELYVASDVSGFGDDAPNERVTVDGAVSMSHGTAPTATSGFGKIYVDGSTGHLIYLDESGDATDLTVDANAVQSVSSSANTTGRIDHMRFIPGEASEITESATDDTIYIRFDVTADGSGSCTSAPSTPESIDGPSLVCSGEPGTSFSVPPVSGATYYRWTLPSGSHILSGSGTNAIHAILGSVDGDVSVVAWNECGTSSASTKPITINRPTSPGSITGPSLVCRNQTGVSYNIASVPDATDYSWTVPSGASIVSGSSTPTITVNFGTSPGEICVRTENSCGISDPECLAVDMTWTPSTPGAITGITDVCEGATGITYSIASVDEATDYTWTLPSGATIASGDGTASIDVDFGTASGDICVNASNSCGTSSDRCISVTVQEAPAITSHPSNISVSEGDPATFSITATGSGLDYQWQENTGSSFVNITSATSSSYTISSTTAGMDGYQYRCIVSNSTCSSVTSTAATLTVTTELYAFTSHTFTNCGATGHNGPTIAQCRSEYSTSWDDTYLDMSTQGIQEWTVPADGTYRITAAGAEGAGLGGDGAIMQGEFTLSRGEILKVAVGQVGLSSSYYYGGGGGSFVVQGSTPLIIAGGGGGGESSDGAGCNANTTENGNSCGGNTNPEATDGAGGTSGGDWGGAGGGGFNSDGARGYNSGSYASGSNGKGWGSGLVGGYNTTSGHGYHISGGFGGGGSPTWAPGGGGGYSAGAGRYSTGSGSDHGYGGGGGSYNSGTAQSNSIGNTGHGYVTIEKL
ncbi:MAG: hypothetical protein ACLFSQ_06855 [Candidatus Zixiibacteriota bacterium]